MFIQCHAVDVTIERKLLLQNGYHYESTSWAEAAGLSIYSHGSISNNSTGNHAGWRAVAIPHDSSKEVEVLKKEGNYLYIPSDTTETAFFHKDGYAIAAKDYDLAYEYTMPCKATIYMAMSASLHSADTDGSSVYAYVNDTSNCIINRTNVTKVGFAQREKFAKDNVTLNKGDKIYFRLNSKETVPSTKSILNMNSTELKQHGAFFAQIVYRSTMPADTATAGTVLKEGWELMAGKNVFTHSSVDTVVENLQPISINLSTGAEEAMVKGSVTDPKTVYVNDGTEAAYLNKSGLAQTSETHDLAYVYTMPWTAKIDLEIHSGIEDTGDTESQSDGVIVYAYINDTFILIIRIFVMRKKEAKDTCVLMRTHSQRLNMT